MKKISICLIVFFSFLMMGLNAQTAQPVKRALVIGNSSYPISPLKNTLNDARDMHSMLKDLGFLTTLVLDGDRRSMLDAIDLFCSKIIPGDTALFYYSGHGFQIRGGNYLIPVDMDVRSEGGVPYASVPLESVLAKLSDAGSATNIVILDACRDNPFPGIDRSVSRGLASETYTVPGTIIVYATAPGAVANDGSQRNGVFTGTLLKYLDLPGIEIEGIMRLVRDDVIEKTAGTQIPWSSSSLRGNGFYFKPAAEVRALPVALHTEPSEAKPVAAYIGSMLRVSGGVFLQGSTLGDECEIPVHQVELDDFFVSIYETTYDEFDEFCLATGRQKPADGGFGRGERPVAFVSWFDACEYCNWRSLQEGYTESYIFLRDEQNKITGVRWNRGATGYRLPTEAEWEYLARGGEGQKDFTYPGSNTLNDICWYAATSDSKPRLVGTKDSNTLGIYDLAGNVWEWCWDWYETYVAGYAKNPGGPEDGTKKALRGGGYKTKNTAYFSVFNRGSFEPSRMGSDIGFRIVRSAQIR